MKKKIRAYLINKMQRKTLRKACELERIWSIALDLKLMRTGR